MNTHRIWILCLVMAGCATQGSFHGSQTASPPRTHRDLHPARPHSRTEPVAFVWESDDGGLSGGISAATSDGEAFSGRFHEMLSSTRLGTLGTFYNSWYDDWQGYGPFADPWPVYPEPEYIQYYSGNVVAQLRGDRGTLMRCYFELDRPEAGIDGGGEGRCQLSDGTMIDSEFSRTRLGRRS
jgi:hypothetical protein